MNQDLKPLKSFWEKPQGNVGMIGLGLLIFGAGYVLLKNAAWIAEAMANLTTAVLTGIALFTLIWILKDKRTRMLIWYFYKTFIEWLTGIFIELNPIGIMKAYVSELKDKRREMDNLLGKLKQEIGKLKRKIDDSKEEIVMLMNKASAASRLTTTTETSEANRLKAQKALNARKAARRKKSAIKLTDILKTMETQYKQMDKMYFYSGIMIDDIEDQVENIEAERSAIHASFGVMKRAASIISGQSSEAEMFDRAVEFVVDDLGSKMGQMERYMDLTRNFMDGVDLDNQVFEEEGLAMLEAWEDEGSLNFLNDPSTDYMQVINSHINIAPEPILLDREVEIKETPKRKSLPRNTGNKDFFN